MQIAQMVIMSLMVVAFFRNVFIDFYGSPAKDPGGFGGFLVTLVVFGLMTWLYLTAGCFSTIIKP